MIPNVELVFSFMFLHLIYFTNYSSVMNKVCNLLRTFVSQKKQKKKKQKKKKKKKILILQ